MAAPPPLLEELDAFIRGHLRSLALAPWRPERVLSDPAEAVADKHARLKALYDQTDIHSFELAARFMADTVADAFDCLQADTDHVLLDHLCAFLNALYKENDLYFSFPEIDYDLVSNPNYATPLRRQLDDLEPLIIHRDALRRAYIVTTHTFAIAIIYAIPPELRDSSHSALNTVSLINLVRNPNQLINGILACFLDDQTELTTGIENLALYKTRETLRTNLLAHSGLSFEQALANPSRLKLPFAADLQPEQLVETYVAGTAFYPLFNAPLPFPLTRYKAHHWAMFARTGHGKTQTLQSLILDHLQEPDPPGMIIIDSESNLKAGTGMLTNIERLALFDHKLRDRLLVIDPRADTPPAINMFDVDELDAESETEAIDLYAYIFRALDQSLTGLQATAFAFVARLMIEHGNANLTTLLDFLSEDVKTPTQSAFSDVIARTDPITRRYFETQFYSNRYTRETRGTIANRLFAILSNRAMQRMFNARRNKVDLFAAMQQKKIVLIAPGGLGSDGTPLFARTMIALALRAAYKRLSRPAEERHPVLLFVDEAHGLFDEQLDTLLIRARKLGLFLRFATQHFDQIPPDMRAAITANTEVFLAGGLSHGDASKLARDMRTAPEFLMDTRVTANIGTEFACFIQNQLPSAIKVSFPFGVLESQPQSDPPALQARKCALRQQFAVSDASPQSAIKIGDRVQVRIGDYDFSDEGYIVTDIKDGYVFFQDMETGVPLKDVRPFKPTEKAPSPSPFSDNPGDYKDSF